MKILIRLPNWLGDVVMATALISAVRQHYPNAVIDVIARKELRGIAELISGLNIVYPFSKQEYKGLAGACRFGKKMRPEKYDIFFNLPTSLSSAVMCRATGAKKRVGFYKEGNFLFLTNTYKRPVNVHRADEYISLMEKYTGNVVISREVSLNIDKPKVVDRKRVLINFNSEASSRRMPVDKAIAIINLLTNTFSDCVFTLIGAPKEDGFVNEIVKGADNRARIENIAGKTGLAALCNLMAGSAALLTTDSGPAHLANAVGTPVIVLFGAGNEYNTAPYNKRDLTIIRSGKLSCEPCVKNYCKLYGIPKCMQLIDELQITNTLNFYLAGC